MKKVVLLLSLMVVCLAMYAQTRPTPVSPDAYVTNSGYQQIWGTSADTLTDSDNDSFVWRINGDHLPTINVKLYIDHVSGTAGGTLVAYHSIDGVNYEATGDTITYSSVTGDGLDAEVIDLPSFSYPYLKVTNTQTGTAVTVPKGYLYMKY